MATTSDEKANRRAIGDQAIAVIQAFFGWDTAGFLQALRDFRLEGMPRELVATWLYLTARILTETPGGRALLVLAGSDEDEPAEVAVADLLLPDLAPALVAWWAEITPRIVTETPAGRSLDWAGTGPRALPH